MPKQVRFRRGTTVEHAAFTGAEGEVTVDVTKKTAVVHDGATAGGHPLAQEAAVTAIDVLTGNLVWVDAVNGVDAIGQRGRMRKSFKTLTAAKTAALSGDTIMVLPGVYDEKNLLKTGVNWHFLLGAKVIYTGPNEGGIFDDGDVGTNSDVVCNITGHGEFVNNGSHVLSWAYIVGHPGTDIYFEALLVGSAARNCIRCIGGKSRLVLQRIKSNGPRAVEMYGGENRLLAQEIVANGSIALDMAGGNNVAAVDTISNAGGLAVHCHWGTHDLVARLITSGGGYGLLVERNEELDPLLVTVRGARIVSTLPTADGIAVYLGTGTNELTLRDCVLISNESITPASASIDAAGPVNVRLYGTVMANVAKGANVTFITGATRFEVDSDVR